MKKHRNIRIIRPTMKLRRRKHHRKTSQVVPIENNQSKQTLSISSLNIDNYRLSNQMLFEKTEDMHTDTRKRWQFPWRNILAILGVLFLVALTIVICILLNLRSTATTTNTTSITSSVGTISTTNTTSISSSVDTTTTTTSTTSITSSTGTTSTTSTTTTTSISLRWNSTGITVAGTGSSGLTSDQLNAPYGISFVSPNSLYIADESNHRIQKWLVGASNGSTVAGLTNGTSGPSGLNSTGLFNPRDVTVDSSGNLYIVDTSWNRVLYWPNGESSGMTVAGQGGFGSGNNQLFNPTGIARDPSTGTLYIADQANDRIMQYLQGASSGTVVAGGHGPGSNSSQLNLPAGVYYDSSSNSLVIANTGANNIVRWVIGASSWTLLAGDANGLSGSTSTLLNNPMDVVLDSMGNMYVADTNNERIQFFLAGQSNGTTIAGVTGSAGSTSSLLSGPYSVTIDNQLNVYVADYSNYRVQQFLRY